jgi:AraC-like DNA-binding protein
MAQAPNAPHPRRFRLEDLDRSRIGLFAGWRRSVAAIFDVGAEPDEIGLFEGDIVAWSTARIALTDIKASRIRLIRSYETIAQSRIDHFAITFLASGSMAGFAGETDVDANVGDVVFKDLMQTLTLQTSLRGELTQFITLWIPRARLLASISNEKALHGLVLKGTSPAGALIGASLSSFAEQVPHMTTREMDSLADGLIELAARALIPTLEARSTSGSAVPLASFVSIRRFIDRNLGSPELGVDMIAKSFGLSRPSLYRLFEPIGGVAGYIRKQRLNRAYQDITTAEKADHRIGPIAYRLGFKNINSFNRAFREAYGKSPGEARQAARRGTSTTKTLTSEAIGAGILAQWLVGIGNN